MACAQESTTTLHDALSAIGFQELGSFGRILSGWLPLASIVDLAEIEELSFARIEHGAVTSVGATTSQGDSAERTDDVRNTFQLNGAGTTVGVISDSFDIAHLVQINPPILTRAADDVASGDLPAGVNVLNDTYPLQVGRQK